MAIKSKARHDLTLLTEGDITEVEALAQAFYDALDATEAAEKAV